MKNNICSHNTLEDLTQGLGEMRHYYCHKCGMHDYKGKAWTKREWAEYVEDFSEPYGEDDDCYEEPEPMDKPYCEEH